jgi:hypothetical protein
MRARTPSFLLSLSLIVGTHSVHILARPSDAVTNVCRFFESLPPAANLADLLKTLRPAPAGPADRARALAVLPETGELSPDRDERAKLAMLETVLIYHDRARVFEIKVIDVPQAAVALWQRTVLLISRPVLRLVSGAELQALVAHEIAHDYFWEEFERTLARGDRQGRRELELKCDGIAVLTLTDLKLDPTHLEDGLRKQLRFNEMLGIDTDVPDYPRLQDRHRCIMALRDFAELKVRIMMP